MSEIQKTLYHDPVRDQGKPRKRRRTGRACDICRGKKVRCDISTVCGNKCSNCIAFAEECTSLQPAPKKHASAYPKGYVQRLQERISQVDGLLHKINPTLELPSELDNDIDDDETWFPDGSSSEDTDERFSYLVPPSLASTSSDQSDDPETDDDELSGVLSRGLAYLSIDSDPSSLRFLGKSSPLYALKNALEMREFVGLPLPDMTAVANKRRLPACRCPMACTIHPGHPIINLPTQPYDFPPEDLLFSLAELYFAFYNAYTPLLHRQLFLQSVFSNQHLRDERFGAVVLLVCALGSKVSEDPRVLLDSHGRENAVSTEWYSAGWKWFKQVDLEEKTFFSRATVYDIEVACLSAMFLSGTSSPDSSHICTSLGLRLAQDIGAHKRKTYQTMSQVDEELLKRAFWVLVYLDWSYSSAVGRPSGILREDIDVDLPTECDDESWLHPDPRVAFRQPPGVPSTISFFHCLLRLSQIHAFAYRTLYSSPKARRAMKIMNPRWEERVVGELDAALSHWMDGIPVHLQWDPHNPATLFLSQSATLYASYYALQIAIHRPFIPYPLKSLEPSAVSNLEICTTAARACVRVLDKLSRRTTTLSAVTICDNLISLFLSGTVLLLGLWREKELQDPEAHTAEDITDVQHVMQMLKAVEPRWHSAGRIWDMLNALASAGDVSLASSTSVSRHSSPEYVQDVAGTKKANTRMRHTGHIGRHFGDPSLIYHHPFFSGIAAAREKERAAQLTLSFGPSENSVAFDIAGSSSAQASSSLHGDSTSLSLPVSTTGLGSILSSESESEALNNPTSRSISPQTLLKNSPDLNFGLSTSTVADSQWEDWTKYLTQAALSFGPDSDRHPST